jgi:hypothetical protein
VLHFLTIALAHRNPAAYLAHFRRLALADQQAYLATLDAPGLATHVRVTGTPVTVGYILTVQGQAATLASVVAGQALPKAEGWAAARQQVAASRALAQQLGSAAVSGLLELTLDELALPTLATDLQGLGWTLVEVLVWVDTERQVTEWNLSGTLEGGSFWSRRQRLRAPREVLEAAAAQLGARLEVSEV